MARGLQGRARQTWVDTQRQAQATNGVPIGAGNLGLVRSARTQGTAVKDTDLDGIPNPLDIDDDGDLILDDADVSLGARASAVGDAFPNGSRMTVSTHLEAMHEEATNADGGSTDEQIAQAEAEHGELNFFWMGVDPGSAELDCGTLIYCSPGGTGMLRAPSSPFRKDGTSFPACCPADGNGLGTLTQTGNLPGFGSPDSGGMTLFHGATGDQIGTGDVLIVRATANGVPFESATTVGFAFSTAPVLAAYSDGQGDSSTFSYPRPASAASVPVRAGPDGDVVLTVTLWRPQRTRIEAEPGSGRWIDMGNLAHMVSVFVPSAGPSSQTTVFCPQSSLSEADPNLTPAPSSPYEGPAPDAGGFLDHAGDQPANPANTFTYTVNLTRCAASKGFTLAPNDVDHLSFLALAAADQGRLATAVSSLRFQVQG